VLVTWHMWLVWILTTKRKSMKRVENFERYVIFSCYYSLILLIRRFVFAVLTRHFRYNLQTVLLSGQLSFSICSALNPDCLFICLWNLDDGHIQLTGNGCGTPPQLTIFIEWRTVLSTTISHLSPDATHAQIWVTHLPGQSRSIPTMLWACRCLYRGRTPHTSTN
jgi:hypothetical protein